jgi:hypothetical protein
MTIAERSAKAHVIHLWNLMQNPVMRGPRWNPHTFDIRSWVLAHMGSSYRTKIPPAAEQKGADLAVRLWQDLCAKDTETYPQD